jgi:hypothetical protein
MQHVIQNEELFNRILKEIGEEFNTKQIGEWKQYEHGFIQQMSSEDLIVKTGRQVGRHTNVWRIRKKVIEYLSNR